MKQNSHKISAPAFANDAQRLSLLFDYGVVTAHEVIQWADSQIVISESPPGPLIELSTTAPNQTADVISHLHALSAGADFWQALRAAVPRLHEYLTSNPKDAERIANALYRTVITARDVPTDFQFAYLYDDAFSLVRENVYGDIETIRKDFIREFGKFPSAH